MKKKKTQDNEVKCCPKGLEKCFCLSSTSKSINEWAAKLGSDNSNPFNFHGVPVEFDEVSLSLAD